VATRSLSEQAVADLYTSKVAINDTPEYCERYQGYDFRERFGSKLAEMEFPRIIILLEFERLLEKHGIAHARKVLMLNGGPTGDPELQRLTYDHVDAADYEADPRRYDLHRPEFAASDYDFVILSQTLEHLYDPVEALGHLYAAMAPGGYIWASTPTVSQQHSLPNHFATGFTPIGMACLFAHTGFEVVEIGQWGNSRYANHSLAIGGFPTFYDLARPQWRGLRHLLWTLAAPPSWRRMARRWYSLSLRDWIRDGLRNDFATPVQTWALARRPTVDV